MTLVSKACLTRVATALILASTLVGASASAQATYPERAVKLVVPFAPGGSADGATRVLAEKLGQKWKQPVVVENKPGASSSIGALHVAKSTPDGYTLLVAPVSIGTIDIFLKSPGFDRDKELQPITHFARGDYVLSVGKNVPANTLSEFVGYAKANPTKVFHGAFGGGSMLAFEGFAQSQNIRPESVMYRGEALALNALLAGDVQVVLSTLMAARPFIEAGRIKPLGVPSRTRSPVAPAVPSADESGVSGFYADFWFGLMTPTGTPAAIRDKVAKDVADTLALPEVKSRFLQLGLVAESSSPEGFAKMIRYESERWVDIAKKANIEPQ